MEILQLRMRVSHLFTSQNIITRTRNLADDTYNIVKQNISFKHIRITDPLYQSNMSNSSQHSEFNEQQLNDLEQL